MSTTNKPHTLIGLLQGARVELGFQDHIAVGNTVPHARTLKAPAVVGHLRLQELLPSAPGGAHDYPAAVVEKYAGKRLTLSTALAKASLVAQAGAMIIPVAPAPVPNNAGLAVYAHPSRFSVINPAPFAVIADGANVGVTAFPANRTPIAVGDAPTHAVRFEISRRDQKTVVNADEVVTFETMEAISRGIGQTVDSVLLSAIASSMPGLFSLAAAASKGLKFHELRAIAGTSGAAAVGADGVLRAQGIQAELTDVIGGTFIGAFSRAAMAIHEEITLIVERTDVSGKMAVTALVNMQPLLPEPDAFWTVA